MAKKTMTRKNQKMAGYDTVLKDVAGLLESARRASARATNAVMTATYWEIGRRIVEHEQSGEARAEYGAALIKRLSVDLTSRFGRGFSERNLEQMRLFYQSWRIPQTVSAEFNPSAIMPIRQTASAEFITPFRNSNLVELAARFPLPWSHYVRLLSLKNSEARAFYEKEALRGGQ